MMQADGFVARFTWAVISRAAPPSTCPLSWKWRIDLRRAVLRQKSRWKADHVVIEDAGSGKSLRQDFHAERRARGRDAFLSPF